MRAQIARHGPRIRQQTARREIIEHGIDVFRRLGRAVELAGQFRIGVVTSCEQANRLLAQFFHSANAGSASSTTPTAARTLFSISAASSGCSMRNSRALSLPWPIFSPL